MHAVEVGLPLVTLMRINMALGCLKVVKEQENVCDFFSFFFFF